MAGSMFGFAKTFPTLGGGKASVGDMNVEEFEEDYDALNDETFGGDLADGDWEEGHDKLTEMDSFEKSPEKVDTTDYDAERQTTAYYLDGKHDKDIAHTLSQLMLDDEENDDPAIMRMSKSKPLTMRGSTLHSISPPPAAIVESDHVGSPSTNSIWSTAATPRMEHTKIQGRDAYVAAFLSSLKSPSLHVSDLHIDDPCIVSAAKDFQRLIGGRSESRPPNSSSTPKLIPNVRTLEDIERDMMLLEPKGRRKSPTSSSSSVMLHEEVERDILLKPRVRTVSEIEREIVSSDGGGGIGVRLSPRLTTSSPPLIVNQQQRVIRPPPGLTCNGAALLHRPQVGPYVLHQVMHPGVTSPLTIHGHRPGVTSTHGPRSSSPVQLLASHSPPPFLLAMSPQKNSPPAYRVTSPRSPVWLRSFPANRMIPPQLNACQRRLPHPARRGANQAAQHQGFLFGQLHYPPMQVFPFGPPPRPPNGPPRGGGIFHDPRQMRITGPPMVQQQQTQQHLHQQQQSQVIPRVQHKRNSWSEPSSRGPQFTHPHQYNNYNNNININHYNFKNNTKDMSRKDLVGGEDEDEYANLMTQREKDWLVKIQLMQLQTDNPYLDDYYYTTFVLKKKTKELDKDVESTLVIPERSKAESRIYQPTQFEGSLGRLQVLSVNCPRKIIDLGQHHSDEGDLESQKVTHRELKKFRQLLLDIEKLYGNYLEIDDIDKKAAALPEEARTTLFANKSQIIRRIHSGLVSGGQDRFAQLMSIRKGRQLVLRVLPRLSKEQIDSIVILVLSNLAIILKKDQREPVMPRLWTRVSDSLNDANFTTIVTLGLKTLSQNSESTIDTTLAPSRSHLNAFVSHEVGLRVFDDLMRRVDQLLVLEDNDDEAIIDSELKQTWSKVIEHLADAIVGLPDTSLLKATNHMTKFADHMRRFSIDETKVNVIIQKLK